MNRHERRAAAARARKHSEPIAGLSPVSNCAVSERVENIVWASDRAFFDQHPRRKYRLRPAWNIEMEDFDRHAGPISTPPEGGCWWVVVHEIRPGVRVRLPFIAPHHLPTESSEGDARHVWEQVCAPAVRKGVRVIGAAVKKIDGVKNDETSERPGGRDI